MPKRRTQALVPFMVAAGMTPKQIVAAEAAMYAAPLAYAYHKYGKNTTTTTPNPTTSAYPVSRPTGTYENKNLTYSQMPLKGAYRTRGWTKHPPPGYSAPLRKKGRNFYNPRPQYSLKYDSGQDFDKKVVYLKDIISFPVDMNGTSPGLMRTFQVRDCPGFTRISNLYDRFKLLSMSVKFLEAQALNVISMVSQDDVTVITDRDTFLRQPSFRLHNTDRLIPAQRTMHMRNISQWTDYIKFSDAATSLGDSTNPGPKQASIKWYIKTKGAASGTGSASDQARVECLFTFKVQVMGLKDTTDID